MTDAEQKAFTQGRAAGLEEAAKECDLHATQYYREANGGDNSGASDWKQQAAEVLAEEIRNLKSVHITPLEDERKSFEYAERASDLERDPDEPDMYLNQCVQASWEGWKKRAALSPTPSEAGKDDSKLDADDVEWVVNDIAELGVKIKNQFFFLYKGESLVYEDAKHDNGTPMHWRRVFKREFGECAHPINHADYSKIGTVSLEDSDDWKVLPAALSSLEVIGKGEKG